MIIDSANQITQYRVLFYPDEHPEIFGSPLFKRKSMCMDLLGEKVNLVDPIIKCEWLSVDKIELVVYSY